MFKSCRPERRHISFRPRRIPCATVRGRNTVTSHLLPTYARVHLAFERGEGVWLIATNGDRYLDFTSGVAVNALGHAHPQLVAALAEQAQKLWHVSNLYRNSGGRARCAATVRCQLCRRGVLLQFRRRGDGMHDQDGAQISSRRMARRNDTASLLLRAHSTAARWQRSPPVDRKNISTALVRSSKASTMCRSAISRRPSARSRPKPPPY